MTSHKKKASRTVSQGATGKPVKRGAPFKNGDDPRRNKAGRKAVPKRSPVEEAIAAIMAPVVVMQGRRRTKRAKIAVVIEQQLSPAMQGDQAAARTVATVLRAVAGLVYKPETANAKPASPAHDEQKLERVLRDFERRITKAAKAGKAS